MASQDIRVINPISDSEKRRMHTGRQSTQQLRNVIERQWDLLPTPAKGFLLAPGPPICLRTLATFWSSPARIDYTRGEITAGCSGVSWLLAQSYLKLGGCAEARALTLNGSFLRQCTDIPIEKIVKLCEEHSKDILDKLPIFRKAIKSLQSPSTLASYLLARLPYEYQHMMGSLVNTQSRNVMNYVDQIGDDWSGDSSSARNPRITSSDTTSTETKLQLILVSDANMEERHSLSIGSSTTLKTLFNDYALERGASLRSLRFSYRGNTLFLSSAGKKTPDQLNMRDQDVITVFSASRESGSGSVSATQTITPVPKKATPTKNQTKKTKGKGKKKKKSQREVAVKTLEEWKAQHSNKLSKLHEEVHHRLKEIRTRLNAQHVKCQLPKQKKKKKRKLKDKQNVDTNQRLPHLGISGKAGKMFFCVQVGEVDNLYKTTRKSSQKNSHNNATTLLDLHGCTREEALQTLDKSLPVWVDTAMRGSYPFVMPAKIVCGGGHQILSETVEKWIREHAQVANAMKHLSQ